MSERKFVDTIEMLAYNFQSDPNEHNRFLTDANSIIDALIRNLVLSRSLFRKHLQPIRNTVASVLNDEMDLPLTFEIFLPVRLPYTFSAKFNAEQRTVQLKKRNFTHPFFFGNLLNANSMNLVLQRDLEVAVAQISTQQGTAGAIYELSYSPLCYNRIPFGHRIFAEQRDSDSHNHDILIDFVLALEFDGAAMPLPPYFEAPLSYKWLAFGLVPVADHCDGSTWAVLLPRWQTDTPTMRVRGHRTLQLLYRLLYAERCYCFAVPLLIKLSFFMTTADYGDAYKSMSVAQLMITTLGHQVFRNFCKLIVESQIGEKLNICSTNSLREQQLHCQGIFAMLVKGFQMNVISDEFISRFYQFDPAENMNQQQEKETEVEQIALVCRKRHHSI